MACQAEQGHGFSRVVGSTRHHMNFQIPELILTQELKAKWLCCLLEWEANG